MTKNATLNSLFIFLFVAICSETVAFDRTTVLIDDPNVNSVDRVLIGVPGESRLYEMVMEKPGRFITTAIDPKKTTFVDIYVFIRSSKETKTKRVEYGSVLKVPVSQLDAGLYRRETIRTRDGRLTVVLKRTIECEFCCAVPCVDRKIVPIPDAAPPAALPRINN